MATISEVQSDILHHLETLERYCPDWPVLMLEVYFDDSSSTDWIAAACYVSSCSQWKTFAKGLSQLKVAEGFCVFHMADLAAAVGEFVGWSMAKRKRVYKRMAALISECVQYGFSLAFLKQDYDVVVPEYVKAHMGHQYYPVAVDLLLGEVSKWRKIHAPNGGVQYVIDRNAKGKGIRGEILRIEEDMKKVPGNLERFGMNPLDGLSEQNKAVFLPLQAADVLAWQWSRFMASETGIGLDEVSGFYDRWQMKELFDPKRYSCGHITAAQFRDWVSAVYEHETAQGLSGFLSNSGVSFKKTI